ncbi:MAG TPA: type II secretion system F family protein [bacterium]|nr:type II secretion system F family protein [bacterium]
MGSFAYRAIDPSGRPVAGIEAAESSRELLERLHVRGVLVTDVREVGGAGALARWQEALRGPSNRDLALLFRQLATLLQSGMPLAQALAVLEARFPQPRLRAVIAQVRIDVEEGHALSAALARHPRYFSALVAPTVQAGEAAGALDVILPRLAAHFEKEHGLRQKLRSAAIYPAIVGAVSVAAITFLMTYVVPTLVGIFEGLQATLPWQTRLLIAVADGIRDYWPVLLAAIIVVAGALVVIRRRPWGSAVADRLALSLPAVGRFNQQVITSRFCRTLATLLASGIPLLRALDIVANTVGNRIVREQVLEVQEGVRTGGRLGRLLTRQPVFPPLVGEMVTVGEEAGTVDAMLDRAADFQDVEVDYALQALTTALEPTLILAMGVIVGFVVVSMYLPLFDLVKVVR